MVSNELFASMAPALATEVVEFAQNTDKKLYQAVLEAVAAVRRLRPVFLDRQPQAERTKLILSTLKRKDMGLIADNLIRHWLLSKHPAILCDFLNALGIKNDKGVVETLPGSVGDGQLKSAIDSLLAKHPNDVVAVYLNAFNQFNQAGWSNLDAQLKEDIRLMVG